MMAILKSMAVKTAALFLITGVFALSVRGQDDVSLRIGDPAPPLKYSKWIKGKPVKSFKGDHLYILEFWATWCGPCKAAMPHLTKLQKEYKGKATIIGVGVWEKVKEGQPYESSLPMVTKYVEGNKANMEYSVIADNNDKYMGNNWLKAAGQNGIPATFIIKDQKIIWIGHPIALDSVLPKMVKGSYNMQEYKIAFEKKAEASQKRMAGMKAAMKNVQDALNAKDYQKAFELMEKVKAEQPILKISMDNLKFTTLLKHFSKEEAIAFASEWQKDFKSAPLYVLMAVAEEEGLPQETYLWAAGNCKGNTSDNNPMVFHMLASVYAKGGDYKNAIINEEKAIEGAKKALKEGKMVGSIMDYTVTEYEEALAGYRKAEKTNQNRQQKPFTIKGNIKGKTNAYIYLTYAEDEARNSYTTDSSLIENGRFSFKGALSGPIQAWVGIGKNPRSFYDKYVALYITPGDMQLTLDYDNFSDGAMLKGSPVQAEAEGLNKSKAPIMAKIRPLSEAYEKANAAYIDAMKAKKNEATLALLKDAADKAKDAMGPYQKQIRDMERAFMDKNPSSYVTASMLRMYVSGMPLQEGELRYNKLPDEVKNSGTGKAIRQTLDELRGGSPGAKAFEFTSTELRGGTLSLADYKGKYVLLDFWASWCVPCRKGNPHLLSLYSKYKNKGLEIIGVSDDDRNHEAWKKAVDQDKIGVWKHVLRGLKRTADGGFDRSSSISDRYGISSLPTKILIDPNGVIIGRYGGGGEDDEAMDKKLAEIFGV